MLRHQHLQPAPNVLFSSRRRRRPQSYSGQTRIPDWVWGAGLGLIVVIFIGGYFVLSTALGGSSPGTCDKALAPLRTSDISAAGFQEEEVGLSRIIARLQAGDRAGAEAEFYQGPLHGFTHNIDPPLREKNEGAAKQLCEEVLNVESIIEQRGSTDQMAASLVRIREYLRDAAVTLGYPRPAASSDISGDGFAADFERINAFVEGVPYGRTT